MGRTDRGATGLADRNRDLSRCFADIAQVGVSSTLFKTPSAHSDTTFWKFDEVEREESRGCVVPLFLAGCSRTPREGDPVRGRPMLRPVTTLAAMTVSRAIPRYVAGFNSVGHVVLTTCPVNARPANRSVSHRSVIGTDIGCSSACPLSLSR